MCEFVIRICKDNLTKEAAMFKRNYLFVFVGLLLILMDMAAHRVVRAMRRLQEG